MEKEKLITDIINSYSIAAKKEGVFISGNEIPHSKMMLKLGYVNDVQNMGGKSVRGFWVLKRTNTEDAQAAINRAIDILSEYEVNGVSLRKTQKQPIIFTPRSKKIPHNDLIEIEKEILNQIQPAKVFKGILVTVEDINFHFKGLEIRHEKMRSILSGLGFVFYKNGPKSGLWINKNANFKNRFIVPENFMKDRITEMWECKKRVYVLCPECLGLCTREYRCSKCFGFKIIKKSEV